MFTVTVHMTDAARYVVQFPTGHPSTPDSTPEPEAEAGTETDTHVEAEAEDKGPSPIAPELKELAWGAGSFIVLLLLMRVVLFPRVRKGMDARYGKIRGDHEAADALRAQARAEVATYEQELAAVKAEAARQIEAVRQELEAERAAALGEVNGRIAARRAEANAAYDAAKAAASQHIRAAVVDVSGRAAELATGRKPGAATVEDVVSSLMGAPS